MADSTADVQPHLVLHFDVNETIMVGDPAGGDSYQDSLNKVLAKSAFCRVDGPLGAYGSAAATPTVWHDGIPMADLPVPPPPLRPEWTFDTPPGVGCFYKQSELKRAHAKCFADPGSPGVIYERERDRLQAAMAWQHAPHPALSEGSTSALIPAFYRTLDTLRRSHRPFSVVLRTFGTDLPRVRAAINAFAAGEHPDYPEGAPELALPAERMWRGVYDDTGRFSLRPHDEGSGAPTITDEVLAVAALSVPGVSAIQDNYEWWSSHGYQPSSGKPLWLTLGETSTFQLFFDDNIHNDPDDSIVSVRARADDSTSSFAVLSGAQICELHGLVLRRVPTMLPILDTEWFLEEIRACEARLAEVRQTSRWAELSERLSSAERQSKRQKAQD